MQTTADHLDLTPPRDRRWGRPFGLALLAHALLIGALTWGVNWRQDGEPAVFEAEVWSRLPQQAAPRAVQPPPPPPEPPRPAPAPTPAPAPAAAPPPPAPTQADIAVAQAKKKAEEEKKAREEEAARKKAAADKAAAEKLAAQKKAEAEKKATAEKERQQKLAEQKREQERQAAETKRLDQLRDDQIKRMMGQAGATGGSQSTGTAQQSSGPTPGYAGRVAARIRPNVVFTDVAPGNPRAEVEVRTTPDGTITSRRLVKSSGNAAWDDAVLRAIDRTATLPKDTTGTVPSSLVIGLRPLD
ncbi:cell envelope integrity protein TolA [Hydrogenophaga sp.]|uniref:cell envelope integrity protein TolA n=1 Tax=Hydrogenophaga sp. TaxID=1904254 RepID=UPI0026265B26|nr:cell envelope integrity protein TolA [Hydrogenophaga sp.]MCW5654085.1 cell envelope integrity protein TolA [Hydrogenophaga sp.]